MLPHVAVSDIVEARVLALPMPGYPDCLTVVSGIAEPLADGSYPVILERPILKGERFRCVPVEQDGVTVAFRAEILPEK